ncbi:hypothetical protein [Christiangramia salexigens]|uniref:Glycosyltransferase RgtA/B/C/D-like domain-containing protein n=1 Tax=Christiangramia salexigens TaxID=1913577 RepID=A0A1L3J2D8_9FLAO|nr:hypothetical protein [Christiangramia salexigens]APG59278.1 hypothetical protein LPB144_02120 [Christiangramia salexigens]
MIGVIFLILFFFGINQLIFGAYSKQYNFIDKNKLNLLYLYHSVFYGVYLWYAYNNPSDSKRYYKDVDHYSGDWLPIFGTGTEFMNFLTYPFTRLGFSYEMTMFAFSWFGFLGFFYAYLFFREKIPIRIVVFKKIDLFTLILFFPNMHFWTASLGKGSVIFLGLMMFTYAIVKPGPRWFLLGLGSIIIYLVRPHVFMFVAVGTVLGYMSGREKISFRRKFLIYAVLITGLILAKDQILAVVGLQGSDDLVGDFGEFSEKRTDDLSSAGSGVNMASYPLPLKLFTFWFRPLFIDAPNFLGIITSFENLIYLLLFFKILKKDFIRFLRKSPSLVKMSFVIFLSTSFAMTFVMSNLGIIMRQKSMVMYYIFFVIYYYLAEKKYYKILLRRKKIKARSERLNKKVDVATAQ